MAKENSYRQILRSTSIIGGASFLNILIGLLRIKAAALLLGPAGVGFIGLYSNLMSMAATIAGLGFGNVGTRQIAHANASGDNARTWTARRALLWGTAALALVGGVTFWVLRGVLAQRALGDPTLAGDLGWLALAVVLTIASASQGALLNGMRRIGDIARVSVWSSVLSTLLGIGALWWWGRVGVVAFVIAGPLASFLLGHWYVAKLPRQLQQRASFVQLAAEWKTLARLGFAFMVAGIAGGAGQLVVRLLVQRELGDAPLGHFQAAWTISMTYIGFVLGAMGTDYYPRLTAIIHDHQAVNQLVNEQIEVALLLAAPVLLAMLALAPWVIDLLYSRQFSDAADVLRWQILGDVLKIASWPLGFILLASGAGYLLILTEWTAATAFAVGCAALLPAVGIVATGVGFMVMYVVHLMIMYSLARYRIGFRFAPTVWRQIAILLTVATIILLSENNWPLASAAFGILASATAAVIAFLRLRKRGAFPKRLEILMAKLGIGGTKGIE